MNYRNILKYFFLLFIQTFSSQEISAQSVEENGIKYLETYDSLYMRPGFFIYNVFKYDKRLKKKDVFKLFADHPDILKEYKRGNKQVRLGNTMLLSSLGTALTVGILSGDDGSYGSIETGLFIGSFVGLIGGATLNARGNNKIIWSFKDYARNLNDVDPLYANMFGHALYNFDRKMLKAKKAYEIMAPYPEALKYYKRSVKQQRVGIITTLGSLAGAITVGIIYDPLTDDSKLSEDIAFYAGMGGMVIGTGLVLVSTFSRQRSIALMYSECNCLVQQYSKSSQYNTELSLGLTDNGAGFTLTF